MSRPIDDTAVLEKRMDVRALSRLGTALATALGALGVGGAEIAQRIDHSVSAVCAGCGMAVSGAELVATGLSTEGAEGLTEKQRRLRMGYCARKACPADFYLVRFQPVLGLDWEAVWRDVEPALAGGGGTAAAARSRQGHWVALLEPVVRRVGRRVPLGLIAMVALGLWVRAGCRIPGISPAPRVFIVPNEAPSSRPVTEP